MTQQNTMPDVIWATDTAIIINHDLRVNLCVNTDPNDNEKSTKYLRADAVEDEMATVKDENIKLKCDVVALEIKVKCLKAQRDDHTDLPVVDVEVLYKDTSLQDQNYATCNDIEYGRIEGYNAAIDYLRTTYPQGLKWK